MRTLAVSNYKGGVGKTTTAVNLAAIYAARGLRVLLIDLDPQASATDYFGLYDRAAADGRTSIQLLYENAPVSEVAYETEIPNLSVVPSIIELTDQNELMLREQRLRFALDDCAGDYDVAIIDCSPTMKRLAFNAYLCFVKQIFRKSSSNSFGSQHERSSDFTKSCRTYPSFLFPSMSESVTRRLSPLNSTSLPWCTILSTSADASLSSANTVPHFPNSMLVVSTIDWRS